MAGLSTALVGKGADIVGTWVIVFLWVCGSMSIRTHVVVSRCLSYSRGCLAGIVEIASVALLSVVVLTVGLMVQWLVVLRVCVGCNAGMPSG